jgi:DNA helicase-2/ATP-dependent DNA helicase PcrA
MQYSICEVRRAEVLDAAHVKDVLAFLRFVENPRDRVAGFRVMQLLPGVGPAAAQHALDHMTDAADPIEALGLAPAPPRAGDDWLSFVKTAKQLGSGMAGWPSELELARLLVRPASRPHSRGCRDPSGGSYPA